MEYKKLLEEWKIRRQQIRGEYNSGAYTIRSLSKKYNITDARIFAILHENQKSSSKR